MITRDSFKNIDHKYVGVFNWGISLIESSGGVFRVHIYMSLGQVPKSNPTIKEPTDKEWKLFLMVTEKVAEADRLTQKYYQE